MQKLRVVLVGGSFISLETVCFFAEKQIACTVISRQNPFEKVFGREVSSKIVKLHNSKGVNFVIDPKFEINEFKEDSGALSGISLVNGDNYSCDICILAIGGQPCTQFLKNTQIQLTDQDYVIVDKNMKTNLSDVYAAGDITSFPRACLAGLEVHNKVQDNISIGHWGVASLQGKCAALSIVNQTRTEQLDNAFKVVPFFWSTQFGKSIRFSGFNEQYDSIVFHEDKVNELKFAAFYLCSNKVVAVCTVDWDPICAVFSETMYHNIEVRKEHIEKDPVDLKKLLLI